MMSEEPPSEEGVSIHLPRRVSRPHLPPDNSPNGVDGEHGSGGRYNYRQHVLHSNQFDRGSLQELIGLSDQIRTLGKDKKAADFLRSLLGDRRVMLYFVQPSTRTFLSFQSACQILGMQCSEIRSGSISSEAKGETAADAIRTFSSYVDLIIMRSPLAGLCEEMAGLLSQTPRPVPIINAGSGPDQHPTQSLLDIYTLSRGMAGQGGLEGKTICLVGDLRRGRTVRSLAALLTYYPGVHMIFSSPQEFALGEDIRDLLRRSPGITFEETEEFASVIPRCDAIYMTRVQDEWDGRGEDSSRVDTQPYHLKLQHLEILKPNTMIMHPFPRRQEIDTRIDTDPRAWYWKQERNGMWIRVALISEMMGVSGDIREYYGNYYG